MQISGEKQCFKVPKSGITNQDLITILNNPVKFSNSP